MAGFGSEVQAPLAVPVQPLVTTGPGVVTPTAVEQLIQSFRNGSLTAQDIVDHIGPVGQMKQKAELQLLSEGTSPEAQAARKAQIAASGAGAEFQGAQAQAAQSLLGGQTALTASKNTRELADTKWGGGVSAYQQYAPYFGKPALIQDATGQPDYDAMGKEGNGYMRTMAQQNFARMMLEPDPNRKESGVDPTTQQPVTKLFNKWGMEVTPGSQTYKNLSGVIDQTNQAIFGGAPGSSTTAPTPPAAPVVTPRAAMAPGEARAALVNQGMPASQAVNIPDEQTNAVLQSLSPPPSAAPAAKPEIGFGSYLPGSGMVTGPSKNLMTAPDIATDLRKQPEYVQWSTMLSQGGDRFFDTAKRIQAIPVSEQRSGSAKMNTLDMDLAENIIKMEDPGNAIREFKWSKLSEGAPLYERLKNFKAEALRTGSLTPESRDRLIDLGYSVLAAKERSVLPQLQLAEQRAKASGAPLDQIFTARDQQILTGGTLVPKADGTPAANAPVGKRVNVPGRGTGILTPAGLFYPDKAQ